MWSSVGTGEEQGGRGGVRDKKMEEDGAEIWRRWERWKAEVRWGMTWDISRRGMERDCEGKV